MIRFNRLLNKLKDKVMGTKYSCMALCPAHDDKELSLWVTMKADGRIYVHCLAGCSFAEIRKALRKIK